MSDCKVFRTEIDEASDGGALGRDAASHAETCSSCGAALREREGLSRLVRGLARVEAPPDFEFRLRARMAASKPRGGHGVFGRLFPVSGLAWAAAAVCLVTVTAAVYFRQAQPTKQASRNGAEVASVPQANASPTAPESNNVIKATTQLTNGGPAVVSGDANTHANPPAIQRGAAPKRAASHSRERELAARDTRNDSTQGGSLVESVRSAQVRLPQLNSGNFVASHGPAQGIQLGASAGTLRVVLRDERGALVPMRSVSFGSQEPLSRQAASGRLTSKDDEGVW
jgi:hypothetical protein